MSRELLRRELPRLPRRRAVQVAVRINPFRTDEYDKDLQLVRDLADSFDAVILAKAGEAYGAPGDPRPLGRARRAEPPHHHPAADRASQVAQDRARADAVRDGEARRVRHPRLLQGDGHPHHAAPLDRGAQVLPARHPVRGAHRGQGRDRRRGDADRQRHDARGSRGARRRAPLAGPAWRRGGARRLHPRLRGGLDGAFRQAGDPSLAHPSVQGGLHAVALRDPHAHPHPRGGDRGRRADRRRHQVRRRDARSADVRQGAADAPARPRPARALRGATRRSRSRCCGSCRNRSCGKTGPTGSSSRASRTDSRDIPRLRKTPWPMRRSPRWPALA